MKKVLLFCALWALPAALSAKPKKPKPAPPPPPSEAAVKLYNLVRTTGADFPKGLSPGEGMPKERRYKVLTNASVQAYASDDSGAPLCRVRIGDSPKAAEAREMGLDVPNEVFDRGCAGLAGKTSLYWDTGSHKPLTQKNLDIVFQLVEDILANGSN